MRLLRIARRAAYVVFGTLLALFLAVQFQQRLLRHRAERLHDEIVALQLHPGTFADLQRMQTEWGAYAHYDGPCDPQHCIYQIVQLDLLSLIQRDFQHVVFSDGGAVPQHRLTRLLIRNGDVPPSLMRFYRTLGGRPVTSVAGVRIHNNRLVEAGYGLDVFAYPGKDRNQDQAYFVIADVESRPRLFVHPDDNPDILKRGFRTDESLHCLGCQLAAATITAQTNSADIERFNQLNFSCLTRLIHSCMHPADLAPQLWAQALRDEAIPAADDDRMCDLPASTLAREANDIALVKITSTKPLPNAPTKDAGQTVSVVVLDELKNGEKSPPGTKTVFPSYPNALRLSSGSVQKLAVGQQYFVLYTQTDSMSPITGLYFAPCHVLLSTSENRAAIEEGIRQDNSTGEKYDWRN